MTRGALLVRLWSVPELREVTRAMNTMVGRLKGMFDEQAGQVEQLRRQANCDTLTGLSNRAHFMGRLKVALNSEDGSAGGAIVLVPLWTLRAGLHEGLEIHFLGLTSLTLLLGFLLVALLLGAAAWRGLGQVDRGLNRLTYLYLPSPRPL